MPIPASPRAAWIASRCSSQGVQPASRPTRASPIPTTATPSLTGETSLSILTIQQSLLFLPHPACPDQQARRVLAVAARLIPGRTEHLRWCTVWPVYCLGRSHSNRGGMRGTVTTEEQSKIATDTSAADAYLWTALQSANIPVLLMVLAQLTDDLRWIRAPYAPIRTRGMDDNDTGGLPEAIQLEIRQAAFDLLRTAPQASATQALSPELLVAMMTSCMG